MSLVQDQLQKLDTQIDQFCAAHQNLAFDLTTPIYTVATEHAGDKESQNDDSPFVVRRRLSELQALSRALSTPATSSSYPLLRSSRVRSLLTQFRKKGNGTRLSAKKEAVGAVEADAAMIQGQEELAKWEWIVLAKAAMQVYGMVMKTLLRQSLPLNGEIWYWDEVLGSYYNTGLYTVQTAPIRLWEYGSEMYTNVRRQHLKTENATSLSEDALRQVSTSWRQLYRLVQNSVKDRTLLYARTTILSPFSLQRTQMGEKQNGLRRIREMYATGLGLLIDEGLIFTLSHDSAIHSVTPQASQEEWRSTIAKSISLIDSILCNVNSFSSSIGEFEERVFTSIEQDPDIVLTSSDDTKMVGRTDQLLDRLLAILNLHLPRQEQQAAILLTKYGRPGRLLRWWPAGALFLVFGSSILQFVSSRRTEIRVWIQEFGVTARDFWANWVIDPVKNLIGTIRHDEDNEVAIMSRESLRADQESLERMVVDFASDHPNEAGSGYSDTEIQTIRTKVKEGDLSPVLRAYERDLRKPFIGTIRGDLVRALLIQVQKTKVDVEVAIGGIDSLLKSQELVFGLVGLTPGLLITVVTFRWLATISGNRRGLQRSRKQGEAVRLLRNLDRVLTASSPTGEGLLSYKDHGLLFCEVDALRRHADAILPAEVQHDFLEDVSNLSDSRYGVRQQMKVLERIRWAYAKWLQ